MSLGTTSKSKIFSIMFDISIKDLISQGRSIEKTIQFVPSGQGVIRTFSVYRLGNIDDYYRWKEYSIRFLQLYYPADLERFVKYSNDFENQYFDPRFVSNMIGVLEACDEYPSERFVHMTEAQNRGKEIEKEIENVQRLEDVYLSIVSNETIHQSMTAFHKWHAEACILFDKWIYPSDDDWIRFQEIDGGGNGYSLKHEYDRIYSSYQKLLARLREGRNLKGMGVMKGNYPKKMNNSNKINIFISYSHADEKWLLKLKKYLKVLMKFYDSIEYWEDTKLRSGDQWRSEITKAISKANVVILLVSTEFLASDFITSDELPPILRKASEGGTRVLPLIVSPCLFEDSELYDFQAINSPDRTLTDLINDEAAIERVYLELMNTIKELL